MIDRVGDRLGDYQLISEIGLGGMGVVYLSENVHHKRKYALKILPSELSEDPDFRHRFFDEALVMSELNHPRIVRVHHVGESGGEYYYVMEYIEGPDQSAVNINTILTSTASGRVEPSLVYKWVTQIADGLAYAHLRGVVHRDIKPANILLTADNNIKITDFGLAKAVGADFILSQIHSSLVKSRLGSIGKSQKLSDDLDSLALANSMELSRNNSRLSTGATGILGTYDYMSPEQREGKNVDHRSDIYSLGVLIYKLLTGRRPVGFAKLPSEIAPNIVRGWDVIVGKCLEDQRQQRFVTVNALLSDLKQLENISSGSQVRQKSGISVTKISCPECSWKNSLKSKKCFKCEKDLSGLTMECPLCNQINPASYSVCIYCSEDIRELSLIDKATEESNKSWGPQAVSAWREVFHYSPKSGRGLSSLKQVNRNLKEKKMRFQVFLEDARAALKVRDFEKAGSACQEIFQEDPQCREAILIQDKVRSLSSHFHKLCRKIEKAELAQDFNQVIKLLGFATQYFPWNDDFSVRHREYCELSEEVEKFRSVAKDLTASHKLRVALRNWNRLLKVSPNDTEANQEVGIISGQLKKLFLIRFSMMFLLILGLIPSGWGLNQWNNQRQIDKFNNYIPQGDPNGFDPNGLRESMSKEFWIWPSVQKDYDRKYDNMVVCNSIKTVTFYSVFSGDYWQVLESIKAQIDKNEGCKDITVEQLRYNYVNLEKELLKNLLKVLQKFIDAKDHIELFDVLAIIKSHDDEGKYYETANGLVVNFLRENEIQNTAQEVEYREIKQEVDFLWNEVALAFNEDALEPSSEISQDFNVLQSQIAEAENLRVKGEYRQALNILQDAIGPLQNLLGLLRRHNAEVAVDDLDKYYDVMIKIPLAKLEMDMIGLGIDPNDLFPYDSNTIIALPLSDRNKEPSSLLYLIFDIRTEANKYLENADFSGFDQKVEKGRELIAEVKDIIGDAMDALEVRKSSRKAIELLLEHDPSEVRKIPKHLTDNNNKDFSEGDELFRSRQFDKAKDQWAKLPDRIRKKIQDNDSKKKDADSIKKVISKLRGQSEFVARYCSDELTIALQDPKDQYEQGKYSEYVKTYEEVIKPLLEKSLERYETDLYNDFEKALGNSLVADMEAIAEMYSAISEDRMVTGPSRLNILIADKSGIDNASDIFDIANEYEKKIFTGDAWEMEMVKIRPRNFMVGSTGNGVIPGDHKASQYIVKIDRPFWIAKNEVTIKAFSAFIKSHGSRQIKIDRADKWQTPNHPVTGIRQKDADAFCNWLSDKLSRYTFRLPSEGEWEYACRASRAGNFGFEEIYEVSHRQADPKDCICHDNNSQGHPWATNYDDKKCINGYGLINMHGNVWEWCKDDYEEEDYLRKKGVYLSQKPYKKPLHHFLSPTVVIRGGAFDSPLSQCYSSSRKKENGDKGFPNVGFRVVMEIEKEEDSN